MSVSFSKKLELWPAAERGIVLPLTHTEKAGKN